MTMRLTDTEKWRDPWFRRLPPWGKALWWYLCDNCDACGVWQVDTEFCEQLIGMPIPWQDVASLFEGRIRVLSADKWILTKFVSFQFRKGLNPKDPFAKSVITQLNKHGLTVSDISLPPLINEGGGEGPTRGHQAPLYKTGEEETLPLSTGSKSSPPRARLAKALRMLGLPANDSATIEWGDLMQGRGGCRSVESVLNGISWISREAKRRGINVQYAKHAGDLADSWSVLQNKESKSA